MIGTQPRSGVQSKVPKDALDLREHEKLKDAGEDAQDAFDNVIEGIKDETGAN